MNNRQKHPVFLFFLLCGAFIAWFVFLLSVVCYTQEVDAETQMRNAAMSRIQQENLNTEMQTQNAYMREQMQEAREQAEQFRQQQEANAQKDASYYSTPRPTYHYTGDGYTAGIPLYGDEHE